MLSTCTRQKVAALLLAAALLLLAGCADLADVPLLPPPTSTPTPQPTSTPTPARTSTPTVTPSPTPTFVVVIHTTPVPGNAPAPEPALGDLVASSDHVDFYAQPDNYWGGRMADVAPAIEGELHRVAGRLRADIPDSRVTISFHDPSDSPRVRGMNCPARGLYVNPADHGPILTIFADEKTSRVQVLAVAAHELAHYLSFAELGDGGDIILTEGLATWASLDTWSAWQGWPSFDAAVREYLADNIYLTLEETLTFDPALARDLGLSDCFALRDLRYNEWASFVDYVVDRYGFDAIKELWEATPDDPEASDDGNRARPMPTTSPGSRFIVPGDELSARPRRAPMVDYTGVLGKGLGALEQDWLESLFVEHAQ